MHSPSHIKDNVPDLGKQWSRKKTIAKVVEREGFVSLKVKKYVRTKKLMFSCSSCGIEY
jgi:predicted hydrolase (HD superfamily)